MVIPEHHTLVGSEGRDCREAIVPWVLEVRPVCCPLDPRSHMGKLDLLTRVYACTAQEPLPVP